MCAGGDCSCWLTGSRTVRCCCCRWLSTCGTLQVSRCGFMEPNQRDRSSKVDGHRDRLDMAPVHHPGRAGGRGLRHDHHGLQGRSPEDLPAAPHAENCLHEGELLLGGKQFRVLSFKEKDKKKNKNKQTQTKKTTGIADRGSFSQQAHRHGHICKNLQEGKD